MDAPALCDSILQFVGSGLPAQQGDTSNNPAGGDQASGATEQRLQQEGLMQALMGNKLGEFNMRGVEAGMGMVNVTNRKTGKLLNSGRRQRREEQRTPYGRRSSSCGGKSKAVATQTGQSQPQAGDAQVASTQAGSSKAASTATAQPGSSVRGVGSVGVETSPSPK